MYKSPSVIKSVFKDFPYQTHTICPKKYIKKGTKFLIDMFGHRILVKKYNTDKKNNENYDYNDSKKTL